MRYSLGFVLAISLAGLQFIAIISVVSTSYVSSERAILEHARGLMDDAGANAADHTRRFLEPASEAADLASKVLENDIVLATDPAAIELYLFQHLQIEPQLSGIYYGNENGDFIYVMRSEGPAEFRTKLILHAAGTRRVALIWRNADFEEVARRSDPTDPFDPRTRQWYIDASRAKATVWTPPYLFFSSQQPGISVAAPVLTAEALKGVVGVDIEISAISSFLSDLAIGDRGTAMILNENGDVIAHPDPTQIKTPNDDGTLRFVEIGEFEDPITRAAFSDFDAESGLASSPLRSQFAYQNDKYMTLLQPMTSTDLMWTIAMFAPENDFVQGIKDNRRRNIWIAAIISFVTAVIGLTLAELILKPVRAFAVRTSLVSQGEVATTDPLPRTYQELSSANKTLIREIAQRRRADAKVQELSRDLSHFSRVNMMGQMATGLAHELSQPLTAITQNLDTALSVAKLDPNPNRELISILTELDEQAHQGGNIIRALRGFVRKDKDTLAPFDFNELVLQTCRLVRHEVESAGVQIDTHVADIPLAIGNRVQIAQVLINLMRNAVDAMLGADSPVKNITIDARLVSGLIEVSVADTGPGVDPDVTLFKEFQTSKPDGLGLGLSISRTIVEAHNGRLWHAPTEEGGALFCFTVPCETV